MYSLCSTVTSVTSTTSIKLFNMDLYLTILLMVLAFCVGLMVSTCCLIYFIFFKKQVKPDTTTSTDPSTFVHFPSPGLTPFKHSRPNFTFSSSFEDSFGSTMSFGRVLKYHQNNSLELGLQNVLALHKQAYLESLVKGGVDIRKSLGDRSIMEKKYPTRRLFHSTLPTIADVPELPEVHKTS